MEKDYLQRIERRRGNIEREQESYTIYTSDSKRKIAAMFAGSAITTIALFALSYYLIYVNK